MTQAINVTIPAGDSASVVLPFDAVYSGQEIVWALYEQEYGIPDPDAAALLTKLTGGHGVSVLSPPTQFAVYLDEADTIGLLRNYYHEATAIDLDGDRVTLVTGIFTVTATENR